MIFRALLVSLFWFPTWSCALELTLPSNAKTVFEQKDRDRGYDLPLSSFVNGSVAKATLRGDVSEVVWQIEAQGLTTMQIVEPLRQQLVAAGYDVVFECATENCGGFDFRFDIETAPAPAMYVNLTDFRFLSARKGNVAAASILVSRTATTGFLQLFHVGLTDEAALKIETTRPIASPQKASVDASKTVKDIGSMTLQERLETRGHAILRDLDFAVGSSSLSAGRYESLGELAAFLKADADRRVALVGHTDATGSLSGNVALSKKRAASVVERLIEVYQVPRAQLDAEGMGYLSPVAPNTTEIGREENRRVEVILLNTQ